MCIRVLMAATAAILFRGCPEILSQSDQGVQAYYRYREYGRPFAQATLKTGSKETYCAKPAELLFDGSILFINYLRRVKQQDISALVNVETTFAE